jgi:hypothetical protein
MVFCSALDDCSTRLIEFGGPPCVARFHLCRGRMYLTYLDDSGSPDDPNTDFFVLGGLMLFERQTHWLESKIAPIAERFQSDGKYRELHAGPMRTAKEGWDQFSPTARAQATADMLRLLDNKQLKAQLFAVVVEKKLLRTADIVPRCFEILASSVDG